MKCKICGKEVNNDEIGLTKKLINRGSTEFMCKKCLANFFQVEEKLLDEKIKQFKEQGCLLFK